ncbi:MAG: carboxypeptidase regulatory-like domain-containing protein [Pyrinomonadaceae bacterium]
MRKNLKFMITVVSLVFCLSAVAFGQETTGSIEGVVKDATGAVVPNVSVTIKSYMGANAGTTSSTGIGQGYNRSITTDGNGFFRVLGVPPGAYVVTTEATSGFGVATYENVKVILGNATQLDVQVTPGGASAVVDVGSVDAPLDTTANEIATSLSAQKLALLPKGADFTSALKAAPGTRPDAFAGGWSVDGATNAENVFVIDGQDVTNYRNAGINQNNQVPFALVQELQVKSSGFDAEYGGATGGVFSVVTKGGSNQFHGEFGVGFRASQLEGNPRPSQLRFTSGTGAAFVETVEYYNQPKNEYSIFSPTAVLSGPIIKDRVWFFGAWTPQITEQTTNTTFFSNAPAATRVVNTAAGNGGFDTYRSRVVSEYGFARIDAQPFSQLRLSGTFLWNPIVTVGVIPFNPSSFGGNDAPVNFGPPIGILRGSALRDKQGGRNNANNLTFQANYTPWQNLIGSFRYNRGFLNQRGNNYFVPAGNQYICQLGNTTTPPVSFPGACNQGESTASTTQNLVEVSVRETYDADATFLFNGGGRHQLKGGYQHIGIFNEVARGFSQTVTLAYGARINAMPAGGCPSSPATPNPAAIGGGCVTRFGTRGIGSNLAQTVYFQDKWQPISRLTLNLGVRFEKEDVPSFNQFPGGFDFSWSKKIAPRLGFAYDLTGDGKTKIFGSYGKFFDRVKFIVAQGSFGGDFFRVDFFDILPTSGPFTSFTTASVVGDYADPIGGACPTTGFIGSGLSRCQLDFRVASNDPNNDVNVAGGIDPAAKPYEQRELTFGIERELSRNYVFRGRYTNKKLLHAIDDAGALNGDGSAEIYITGNPGEGLHAKFLKDFGYTEPYYKPERQYDAMEIVLEKRLSNNYYFNLNYTLSRLYGNYSGLSNTDELTGRATSEYNGLARSDPGVNRSFDLPFIGGTATGDSDSGRLATDRPHVFNAYGAYIFDWKGSKANSTELSFFQTVQTGTPQTTNVTFFASTVFTKRGDLGRTPTFSQTDFGVTHRYRFGRDDRFTLVGNVNILNLFDQKAVISLQTLNSNGSVAINAFPCTVAANADVCTGLGGDIDFVKLINRYNEGALLDRINTYLAGNATNLNRRLKTYNQPNRYQGVRQVTFGLNLQF